MGKKDTPDLLFHFGQKLQSRIMIQMVFTFHLIQEGGEGYLLLIRDN